MRRAMLVANAIGPQEPNNNYTMHYDHPYFGQVFLAALFTIIGYPDSLNPTTDLYSIEAIWFVPRILTGLLAILDTFLIYKIAECRYNRSIALTASIIFAVLPLTWLTRLILLESVLLPFLLTSILFALCVHNKTVNNNDIRIKEENASNHDYSRENCDKVNLITILLSGIFLGITIFTKIPVFTMIPMIGFLVYRNSKYRGRALVMWLIPVFLIPSMWPTYSIIFGEFHVWFGGVSQWGERIGMQGLLQSVSRIFIIDPLLVVLTLAGFVYACLKRDFFVLLWVIPFLIYFSLVGYVKTYYWIILLPAFSISAARIIVEAPRSLRIGRIKISHKLLSYSLVSVVLVFGLISTTLIISMDLNSSYFEASAFIAEHIENYRSANNITLIGEDRVGGFSLIPNYMLEKNHNFVKFFFKRDILTDNVLLVIEKTFRDYLRHNSDVHTKKIYGLYNNSRIIGTFPDEKPEQYDHRRYPYTSLHENWGMGSIEVRSNY